MDKRLFTAAALLAAGYTAGAVDLVDNANAKAKVEGVTVSSNYALDHAVMGEIKTRVKAAHCPLAEAQEGMAADSCEVTAGSVTHIYWGIEDRIVVDTDFEFAAQVVIDAEQ